MRELDGDTPSQAKDIAKKLKTKTTKAKDRTLSFGVYTHWGLSYTIPQKQDNSLSLLCSLCEAYILLKEGYMIVIANLRSSQEGHRVDRQSPVGNPYFMKNESKRDEVCDKYEANFNKLLEQAPAKAYLAKLLEIYKRDGTITLLCWCAPRRCHAETIKRWLEAQA